MYLFRKRMFPRMLDDAALMLLLYRLDLCLSPISDKTILTIRRNI